MHAIQKAGFGDRLVVMRYQGTHMLSPASDSCIEWNTWPIGGRCTFLKNGRCELHPLGLKPIEGRAVIHNGGEKVDDKVNIQENFDLREYLARGWRKPLGLALIRQYERKYNDVSD